MRPDFACFKMVISETVNKSASSLAVNAQTHAFYLVCQLYRFCRVVLRIARIHAGPYPIRLPLASIPPKNNLAVKSMDGLGAACSETSVVPFQSVVYHCALLNLESIESLATSKSLSIAKMRATEQRKIRDGSGRPSDRRTEAVYCWACDCHHRARSSRIPHRSAPVFSGHHTLESSAFS